MNRVPVISRRQLAALWLALSAVAITACGGGGDAGGTGPNATASAYAAGPITGFGSVIVNGVRYDDSTASVTDDDDGGHGRDDLKLGMMVEVDGQRSPMDHANGLGTALRIRFGSEIVGPLTSVNADGSSLVVLGQKVLVTSTTVLDDMPAGGLGALVGTTIEVHAQFNAATGDYTATRIEPEADALTYKLRGVVADLTATTFTLGGQVVNYARIAAADLPNNLANGLKVRVRLLKTQVNGQWVAVSVRHGVRKVEDRDDAHLRGSISALRSPIDFDVNGLKVNAANASFPDGNAGLGVGSRVEVEGAVVNGVLVATKVELDDEQHHGDRHGFELHGLISDLDTTARTFRLRGVTVSYAGNVTFEDGTDAKLANGAKVEVKGTPSADRTMLVASSIEFED